MPDTSICAQRRAGKITNMQQINYEWLCCIACSVAHPRCTRAGGLLFIIWSSSSCWPPPLLVSCTFISSVTDWKSLVSFSSWTCVHSNIGHRQ